MTFLRIVSAIRRLRPPDIFLACQPRSRLFAHKSRLSLLSPSTVRPQVPFLDSPSGRAVLNITPSSQITRFLSTERKARWKARMRWQLRFHAYFWPAAVLVMLIGVGLQQTDVERKYPTPPDLSFWSRWAMRSAVSRELEPHSRGGYPVVDWAKVGGCYEWLLERLENSEVDGQDLVKQTGGGIPVEDAGRTGLDISMKPESWRRGYYQILLGAARAAEHLDEQVLDTTRRLVFPREMMVGPSNPRPKPRPHGWKESPKEENCKSAFESPQVFYMRILTTNGFSTKQRLDAALAYADWLDFKGLSETAESMFDWALDIAAGGLPVGINDMVDIQSGVVNHGVGACPSENVLKASTALGVHHATRGNVQTALPIFVSLLKARKDLPPEPVSHEVPKSPSQEEHDNSLVTYLRLFAGWFSDVPYPPNSASGNEPPFHTLKEACEEVGLMTFIGEILFATSSKENGLSWTRDAVDAAEAVMWVMKEQGHEDGRERCSECLETGLRNWKKMARLMNSEAKGYDSTTSSTSRPWLGLFHGQNEKQSKRWQEEEAQVDLRIQKTAPLIYCPDESRTSRWIV